MQRHPGRLLAFAFTVNSAMRRGIFTAILWLTRSSDTTRAFSSLTEGEAWLVSRLRSAGLLEGSPRGEASGRARPSGSE